MREETILLDNRQYMLYINDNAFEAYTSYSSERHCNALYELHAVLEGEGTIYIDDKSYSLSCGESVLILPGQYHCFKKTDQNFKHFVIIFNIAKSRETALNEKCFSTEKLALSEFEISLFDRIIYESKQKSAYMTESITSLYSLLLIEILRKRQNFELERKRKDTVDGDRRLGIIDNFFEKCFCEHVTEDELAKMVSLSRRQLGRVLKTHYGQSFREKLRSTRMDYAAWLLLSTTYSVSKISHLSGYASETSFLRTFKEYFGKTPTSYRKRDC